MSLIATDKARSFTPVPAGNHIGRLYQVIDLGTQHTNGKFGEKDEHKIRLAFELFGEDDAGNALTIDVQGKQMPLTIVKKFTSSLHKKATLRRELAAWRGRDFDGMESVGFDITSLIDTWGMVNVSHAERDQQVYSNITGLSPLPSVLRKSCPAAVHPALIFDLDNPDTKAFAGFSDALKATILAAPESVNLKTEYIDQDTGEITAPAAAAPARQPVAPARQPAPAAAPATLSDALFDKNLPMWRSLIDSGKKSADQIIAMINSRTPLTDFQTDVIQSLGEMA